MSDPDARLAGRIHRAYDRYLDDVFGNPLLHHVVLMDYVRVSKLKLAIDRVCPGKRVAEVGTGSGVLAILAAKAGATKVIAIEQTGIIDMARELAMANGVFASIEFIEGSCFEAVPDRPVDVLVTETLGNDPFSEGIVPIVIDAQAIFVSPTR